MAAKINHYRRVVPDPTSVDCPGLVSSWSFIVNYCVDCRILFAAWSALKIGAGDTET
jgi:hypothetical protein